MSPPEDLLTSKEAAAYLRISVDMLLDLARAGQVPHKRLGHRYRFRKSDLARWVEGLPGPDVGSFVPTHAVEHLLHPVTSIASQQRKLRQVQIGRASCRERR